MGCRPTCWQTTWLTERYRERCAHLSALLRAHLPPTCTWTEPQGGYFIWVELPPGADAMRLAQESLAAGVTVVPGAHFLPPWSTQGQGHVRFSFSSLSFERMEEGVLRFGRALAAHQT